MTTEEEVEALRAATREAHEAIKDLRATIREARVEQKRLLDNLQEAMESGVNDIVREGLAQYQTALKDAIDEATKAVYARFDGLADILLGEDRANLRKRESLTEMAVRMREEG